MSLKKENGAIKHAPLPAAWVTAPLFPPLPQADEYTIEWGCLRNEKNEVTLAPVFRWTTGCDNALPYSNIPPEYRRGFDIRHFDIIACLITQYRRRNIDENGNFDCCYNSLLKLLHKNAGDKQMKYLSLLLDDLWNINIHMEFLESGEGYICRVLNRIDTRKDEKGRKRLTGLQLSPDFMEIINRLEKIVCIRFDIKVKMPSLIAQSLYTYIPSRAKFHSESDPWKITLSNLMRELRLPLEKYPTKSQRLRCFTQHKPGRPSIIDQLDKQYISNGGKLRVKLELSKDGSDYLFCTWVEKWENEKTGWLQSIWSASGGSEAYYWEKHNDRLPLDVNDVHRLTLVGFDPEKDRVFFELVKALLPDLSDWEHILNCMKENYLQPDKSLDYPRSYFFTAVRNTFMPRNDAVLGIALTNETFDEPDAEKELEPLDGADGSEEAEAAE